MGIPTLVLREVTERPEGVTAGILRLVGTDIRLIMEEAHRILDNPELPGKLSNTENPFGDGKAAEKIVKALLEYHKQDMVNFLNCQAWKRIPPTQFASSQAVRNQRSS